MFVQILTAGVKDAAAVRAVLEGWPAGAGRHAVGWLGSTAGITDEGQLVSLARFASADAARTNSDRPEQGEWWESLAANLAGEASFFETDDVDVDVVGDLDTAGFVQVMRGRVSDPTGARGILRVDPAALAELRPDILGRLLATGEDGEYAMVVYFTSEADAREGEKKEPPPEIRAQLEKINSSTVEGITYFDLRDPWLASPS